MKTRLDEIIQKNACHFLNTEGGINEDDVIWLIERAEALEKIASTWVAIETNGTSEDAESFYSIVQDILADNEKG